MKRSQRTSGIVALLAAAAFAVGCAGMSPTEQRTLSGGAIGAGAGALIGGVTGHPAAGAAIGGAAGATGGFLYQKSRESDRDWWYRQHDR
jgi:hypothetical protein